MANENRIIIDVEGKKALNDMKTRYDALIQCTKKKKRYKYIVRPKHMLNA